MISEGNGIIASASADIEFGSVAVLFQSKATPCNRVVRVAHCL